jgi:DNA polymerase-3 subunit alpha
LLLFLVLFPPIFIINNISLQRQESQKLLKKITEKHYIIMTDFTHLHVHTQYSILDGACEINKLADKAKEMGMDALAITDHGNMYGVLDFRNVCVKKGLKPILGCEMYVTDGSRFVKDGVHFSGNHLILIAKNFTGYQNLIKLDSLAFEKEAFYRTSRIDEELLFQHSEGLICSSACVAGIIPRLLAKGDVEAAEKKALEYKKVFKDDYYIEIQNHGIEIEDDVRPQLIALAKKLDIKIIATNDVHFINKEDFFAHRILICLNTGKTINEENKLMYSGQEYMKTW